MTLSEFYRGKRVFVTGHTGFKGTWLCWWLNQMGAQVTGFALPPVDVRGNLFNASALGDVIDLTYGDIRDGEALRQALQKSEASLVFHLAAQPFVRASYADPVENYSSNVMGTVQMLEAIRRCDQVKAALMVTTDKCYENIETHRPYIEEDRLGGHDPYSASKAMTELAVSSYRKSFLSGIALATARAGNVLGGGDYGEDRLVPDMVEAIGKQETIGIRSPKAVRPWQHVLDVLHGYLRLVQCMHETPEAHNGSYNFSPEVRAENDIDVQQLCEQLLAALGQEEYPLEVENADLHEAQLLRLDASKAQRELGWKTQLSIAEAVQWSANWYKSVDLEQSANAKEMILQQIAQYTQNYGI